MLKPILYSLFAIIHSAFLINLAHAADMNSSGKNSQVQVHELTDLEVIPELTPEQKEKQLRVAACMETLKNTGYITAKDQLLERYCVGADFARNRKLGRLGTRILAERATELNPFVITPHEMSYILPFVISDNFNQAPYQAFEINSDDDQVHTISEHMKNLEAKYQISFKVPLLTNSLFIDGDALYFAMTVQSWWQVYSDKLSSPFRETNYKPEIFYIAPLPWKIKGGDLGFAVNLEHQSNGQFQGLSRSWNRLHTSILYDTEHWAMGIKVWHRFEEEQKIDPLNPEGDDNPDIDDYYGNYEVGIGYAINDYHKVSTKIRKNWRTGNGAIEVNYSFPLTGRLKGLVQYFSGYGESLIDYNHKQQKLGVGVTLTDIF